MPMCDQCKEHEKSIERLRAEVQRLDIAGTHSCHDDCPKLPCVQRREIERLRAELAMLCKDWCDDDEAIKQQALRVLDAAKVEGDSWSVPRGSALAEMMADELVKLRDELWETKAENVDWEESHDRLKAELAAAKAASVCPVEIAALGDADWEYSVGVKCKSDDDANKLFDWLWERMKDTPPPTT